MEVYEDLKEIYSAGIKAVDPQRAVENHLLSEDGKIVLISDGERIKEFDTEEFSRIFVVGAGKATAPMAKAVEKILGSRITAGYISVKTGYVEELDIIELIEASHPIPDENSRAGAAKIKQMLEEADENDLVISLISGGGSALMSLPPESITLDQKKEVTGLLLKSGATIHEMNAIRKHLSLVKGGNLAKAAYPATVINLMISDVVGDNMDVIASGPFVPDTSGFSECFDYFQKYHLQNRVAPEIMDHIKAGMKGEIEEHPGPDSPVFKKVNNLIIASNIIALKAAKIQAEKLGYNSIILSSFIEGDTRDAAVWHSRIAREVCSSGNPADVPACIISGGETTVMVEGEGLGGRNTEFVMNAVPEIAGFDNITVASIGTDGTDGPTDAAGAFADGKTLKRADAAGIKIRKYMAENDSYHFFEELDTLIKTGPTKTNVMDMRIFLIT